jgi:hypothetical protein
VRLLFHGHQVNLILFCFVFFFFFHSATGFFFIFVAQFKEVCEVLYLMFLENKKFQFSAINFHLGYHFLPHARRPFAFMLGQLDIHHFVVMEIWISSYLQQM